MKVIRLRYRDQAQAIDRVLDLCRARGDQIESKAEEVLTVLVTSDAEILCIATPPRGELHGGVEVGNGPGQAHDVPVDAAKMIYEIFGGPYETHGVE